MPSITNSRKGLREFSYFHGNLVIPMVNVWLQVKRPSGVKAVCKKVHMR